MTDLSKTLSEIPAYSHFVSSDTVDAPMRAQWHAVYWPPQTSETDAVAFAWCDSHVWHAWTATRSHILFENQDDAIMFALQFGVTDATK